LAGKTWTILIPKKVRQDGKKNKKKRRKAAGERQKCELWTEKSQEALGGSSPFEGGEEPKKGKKAGWALSKRGRQERRKGKRGTGKNWTRVKKISPQRQKFIRRFNKRPKGKQQELGS